MCNNFGIQLLFLRSDDIIRLLEQNGQLLNKSAILFLTISLDLMKSSEVRIAGDQSNYLSKTFLCKDFRPRAHRKKNGPWI